MKGSVRIIGSKLSSMSWKSKSNCLAYTASITGKAEQCRVVLAPSLSEAESSGHRSMSLGHLVLLLQHMLSYLNSSRRQWRDLQDKMSSLNHLNTNELSSVLNDQQGPMLVSSLDQKSLVAEQIQNRTKKASTNERNERNEAITRRAKRALKIASKASKLEGEELLVSPTIVGNNWIIFIHSSSSSPTICLLLLLLLKIDFRSYKRVNGRSERFKVSKSIYSPSATTLDFIAKPLTPTCQAQIDRKENENDGLPSSALG